MKYLALALALAASAASAQTDWSNRIATNGMAATEAELSALATPTGSDRFALGGLRFLRGVERALQARWRANLTRFETSLPLLRMPLPPNPAPDPFDPGALTALMTGVIADMAAAREALAIEGEIALVLRPADIWFDLDGDGQRTGTDIGLDMFGAAPEIRFDTADRHWLIAYTHLLSGTAHLVRAFDPTQAIDGIISARAAIGALQAANGGRGYMISSREETWIDGIAILLTALEQQPDRAEIAALHADARALIAENRRFWELVGAETDNDREFIPNDAQVSALGIRFPPGTGARWLEVLSDASRVIEGEALLWHPAMGQNIGLNLRRLLEDPIPITVAGWLQGRDLLPYLEAGPIADRANWALFSRLVEGRGMTFAVILN